MVTNREEIIEEFEEHIQRTAGVSSGWSVGTAKDHRSPFIHKHIVADLGDGLIYREAFTSAAADAIRDHFVNDRGLQLETEAVAEAGKIVFIYRRMAPV